MWTLFKVDTNVAISGSRTCYLSCLSAPKKIKIEWRLILAACPHVVWSPSNYSLFAWILAQRILENSDFLEDGYCYISCWKKEGGQAFMTEREKRSRNSAMQKWKNLRECEAGKNNHENGDLLDRSDQMVNWSYRRTHRKENWKAA